VFRKPKTEPPISWADVNGIIIKLMGMDVKLDRILELLEADDGKEED
jgi:hypothetical protein